VRKPKRVGIAIDMTPMVDVAFLLLIFFMTTTTFKPPEEVTIDLPVSRAIYKVPESDVLIVTITRDSQVYVQEASNARISRVQVADLGGWIQHARAQNPRARMIVKADRSCNYGTMEDVMNVLQESRATRFVLMTEGEGQGGGDEDVPRPEPAEGGGQVGGAISSETGSELAAAGAGGAGRASEGGK
jgi:biopolymer transport protein ExbD